MIVLLLQCIEVLLVNLKFCNFASFNSFFSLQMRDSRRVLECLKKAIRTASQCMEKTVQVQLYVEILNKYMYFYEHSCEGVSRLHHWFPFKSRHIRTFCFHCRTMFDLINKSHCFCVHQVTADILNQLVSKIEEEMSELEAADETSMLKTHFENSLQHLRKRIDVSPDEEK